MVIAPQGFKDQEYFEPKEILQNNSIEVTTASLQIGVAIGSEGKKTNIDVATDYLLKDKEKLQEYEAVVFIGGGGMAKLVSEPKFIELAQEFNKMSKIVAAICVAPVLLANAGILKNKKVTVFPDQESIDTVVNSGAEYDGGELVVDGNIVTASGPKAAYKFGMELVRLLKK
jgi:protease I